MNLLRMMAVVACLALAACAAPASQDQSQAPVTASTTQHPVSIRRTGGPNQPQRYDNSCQVDADCNAKPQCIEAECRCARNACLARREAVDPVIDPAPASSVR
ncbi:hypothetical protein LF41_2826 [Lysobacter dokdonensis DS-58]|uniref:Secreted protein n=1 Tax=Lysobacter dokdonensis DS-58 TaxID=1300345 RepID=A0A0A2WH94_9GAMM|nr:hypothetical protein [Lysobacter dokdonensis]KGQ19566.1 hypothetical protein LF41_2826 [Lysobacter dokdonensis DS-58]